MKEVDDFYKGVIVCERCDCENDVGVLVHMYDFCGRCGNKILVWSGPGEPLEASGGYPKGKTQ